jgi:chromosome segregation ATPase
MNIADILRKNFVMIPVVASILFGTFTGVKYVIDLTSQINESAIEITNLERDLKVVQDSNTDMRQRLARAESTWEMAENLYRQLAETVRDQGWDIKDLSREVTGN